MSRTSEIHFQFSNAQQYKCSLSNISVNESEAYDSYIHFRLEKLMNVKENLSLGLPKEAWRFTSILPIRLQGAVFNLRKNVTSVIYEAPMVTRFNKTSQAVFHVSWLQMTYTSGTMSSGFCDIRF
jgi:hypothetical protein